MTNDQSKVSILGKHLDEEEDEYDISDTNEAGILDEDTAVHVEAPKLVKCEEDDDFVNMFDKMMNETFNETKVTVPRSQQMDIVAPIHLRQNKKSYGKIFC